MTQQIKGFQEMLFDFCSQLKTNGFSVPESIELTKKDFEDLLVECKYYPWVADDLDECHEFELCTLGGTVKLTKKKGQVTHE